MNIKLTKEMLLPLIKLALKEDIGKGDITSEAIFTDNDKSEAYIAAKSRGIFCGGAIARFLYSEIDSNIEIQQLVDDGNAVEIGDIVLTLKGKTRHILSGERILLNFIQRMSGIATKTNEIVKIVTKSDIKILDTRKTLPGFRMSDKYAVKMGGGENHRIGLFDMVMIKDNHIKAAGSITNAVRKIRACWGSQYKIEVETTNIKEVEEALSTKIDIIMLDNMDKKTMCNAVNIINKKAKIEISGNMDAKKIKYLKDMEIDYISLGELTHSVSAFDLSMKFK